LEFHGHESRLTTVAFSADGHRLVSGGYDKTARVWNLRQPAPEPLVLSHAATVRAAAFSPKGEHIATGDDTGTLRIWNMANPGEPVSVDAHNGPLRALCFSSDGSVLITGGDDGAVTQWETDRLFRAEGSEEDVADKSGSLTQHAAPVTRIAISADGRLLATGDQQGEVHVWDLAAGAETSLLDCHEDEIVGLAFLSQAATLLTVGRDRTINVWRSKRPFSPRLAALDNGDVKLWALAVAPNDAAIYAGGRPGYLAAWDLETGERTRLFEGFEGTIDAVALNSQGTHIGCCGWKEQNVVVFDTQTGEKAAEFQTETNVRCVRFSPDDQWLAAGGEDGTLRLWDWRTDADPTSVPTGPQAVYDVAFSPDGCGGDWRSKEPGHVTFWKRGDAAGSWSEVRRLTEHTQAVRTVTFNRDGSRLASAGEDGLVIIWDAEKHVPVARLKNAAGVRPVDFSPSGDRLAVGLHDGTINIWDIARHEIVQRFQSEDDVFALSCSRDGSVLFSVSGEQRIELWSAAQATSTAERIRGWSP
jgi:WD40 repeat protein